MKPKRPHDMDLTERLVAHIENSAKRDAAAYRTLALIEAGDADAAFEAAQQAEVWAAIVRELERPG